MLRVEAIEDLGRALRVDERARDVRLGRACGL
jgi:hypothetical protein